jgi:hypothetical protein
MAHRPFSYDVYAVDLSRIPDSVSTKLMTSRDTSFSDSHGLWGIGRYLWNVDRAVNMIELFDSISNSSVGSIQFVGTQSDDSATDLIDFSPNGHYAFVNLRGPNPLTGNHKDVNNAKGSTPGLAIIKVLHAGKGGELIGLTRLTSMVDGKETADPHGLAVVHP